MRNLTQLAGVQSNQSRRMLFWLQLAVSCFSIENVRVSDKTNMAQDGVCTFDEENLETSCPYPVSSQAKINSDAHDVGGCSDAKESAVEPMDAGNVSNVAVDPTCPVVAPAFSTGRLENEGSALPADERHLESPGCCKTLEGGFNMNNYDKFASSREDYCERQNIDDISELKTTTRRCWDTEENDNKNAGFVPSPCQESRSIYESENTTEETEFRHRHPVTAKTTVEKLEEPRADLAPVGSTRREDQKRRVKPEPALSYEHKDKPLSKLVENSVQ